MTFDEIKSLVANDIDLSENATLAEQYGYHVLKCLNFQYVNQMISKEKATKYKLKLIHDYEKYRQWEEVRKERFQRESDNIRQTEQLRIKLNKASKEQNLSKELWLDTIDCIGRLCGSTVEIESCRKYLEGVEYHEETT